MNVKHKGTLVLAAVIAMAGVTRAEAGWHIAKVDQIKGTQFAPLALSDSGVATGPIGVFGITYGASGNHTSINVFSRCATNNSTLPQGIDTAGDQAGFCLDGSGRSVGFLYLAASSSTVSILVPGSEETRVQGTNGKFATGIYTQNSRPYGFLLNIAANTYLQLAPPQSNQYTIVSGMSSNGSVIGTYIDTSSVTHGFIFNGSTYTAVDVPGYSYPVLNGVNASGEVVGAVYDSSSNPHAFVWQNGTAKFLNPPNEGYSVATGITDNNQISGYFSTTGGTVYGFRWKPAINWVSYMNAPAGSTAFAVTAINASGQLTGDYMQGSKQFAFIATCKGTHC